MQERSKGDESLNTWQPWPELWTRILAELVGSTGGRAGWNDPARLEEE